MNNPIEFRANGKLLITGEYLVLVGASALAMPVRFGQEMITSEMDSGIIHWESTVPGRTWFSADIDPSTLRINTATSLKTAEWLKNLLSAAKRLNPRFLASGSGHHVQVNANYPLEWGLGSSSTLCSLVASWASVNPYQLYRMISQGSGYDIACATRDEMIYYSLTPPADPVRVGSCQGRTLSGWVPDISPAYPGFALPAYSYFAYLGNKQDSAREVSTFLTTGKYSVSDVDEVCRLSLKICEAHHAEELISMVNDHEAIMSGILRRPAIKVRFQGFPGTVKSLGAWGGDFAMFVSGREPADVIDRLHKYGFSPVFRYNEISAST